MADFSSLLAKPVDDVKRPPLLPEGTYFGTINNYKLLEQKRKDGTIELKVKFTGNLTHAHDDVSLIDEEGNPISLEGRKFPGNFAGEYPIDGEYLYTTIEFIKSFGIDTAGKSLGEIIPLVVGQSVQLAVTHRPYTNQQGETQMVADTQRMSAAA